ncbi:MAG TPA: BrnA antitoxin family protein [Rubrobacter sp.]|nr:BrnA antitoxin family protein [Rubrobacter sp.]
MKPERTSKSFPGSPEEIAAAIARAPERVQAPECSYDPNNPGAGEEYWKGATVRHPGQRGPGKKAKKILLSVRYSPEVVEYFKSTGEGWQTRMDEALQDWVAAHRSR